MIERLEEDHARARRLAEALAQSGLFQVDPASVKTEHRHCTGQAVA
jgi:hypothetical protein